MTRWVRLPGQSCSLEPKLGSLTRRVGLWMSQQFDFFRYYAFCIQQSVNFAILDGKWVYTVWYYVKNLV